MREKIAHRWGISTDRPRAASDVEKIRLGQDECAARSPYAGLRADRRRTELMDDRTARLEDGPQATTPDIGDESSSGPFRRLTRHLPERVAARVRRDFPLAVLDIATVLVAYLAALALRFDGSIPAGYWHSFWLFLPAVASLHILSNLLFGLYGQMWRYASVQEARRVVLAGLSSAVVSLAVATWLGRGIRLMPLTVILVGSVLSLGGFGAIRFQSRLFALRRRGVVEKRKRVLIVGAGDAGSSVLKDFLRNPSFGVHPVGFLDDDARKIGRSLHGVPVLGSLDELSEVSKTKEIEQVIFAIPSAPSSLLREVAALADQAEASIRVLPSVQETLGGKITARDLRDLKIEDLLGRQQVKTDLVSVARVLGGRRVLVTGAGGSIGSEIARQVLAFSPTQLVLLDHDESHLHNAMIELEDDESVELVLVDIRDRDRLFEVFSRYRPQVVFHAAAHKHVPLLETHPEEALHTNVIGTANVADVAVMSGVERFVLISTDKAIRPSSVMGASKWLAEQIVRSLPDSSCGFCAVRFGNVLGSRGSVVPTFFKQVERGGPVTVTDPLMTRYFMSVEEAVQLVLQAGALSSGDEVFTLDMGEPVKIIDLARKIIQLSGQIPGRDVEISIIGPRPGEKISEDIVNHDEESVPSAHPSIVVSRPPVTDRPAMVKALRVLEHLASQGRRDELKECIKALAGGELQPEFAGELL
jgi:FlaA1/EpsC-like NDP-sugar epimerase